MHSAASVANSFLQLAEQEGKRLTNMQVQKLVFFAHGVHLAAFDGPLISDQVKAWTFGPVIPPLYNKLKKFGNGVVTERLDVPDADLLPNDPDANKAIEVVWRAYKNATGTQLSKISHLRDTPWDIVWNQQDNKFAVIPDDVIRDYYVTKVRRKATTAAH